MKLSFKKFIEDMDNTPEKNRDISMGKKEDEEGMDYLGGLGEELGIEFKDIAKILGDEPWVSAHFGLGRPNKEVLYKLSAWEIVKGSLTPQGADIRLKPEKGDRSYLHGNRLNKSKYEDKKRYHLNRAELIKFLTTGWTPAVQAAQQGGEMGGMGDMSGGMGDQNPMGGMG